MPKHAQRLILLVVAFAVIAVAARYFLVDKSFYEYGHYRGNAVAEIAHDKPKFQGTEFCKSCHAAQFAQWSKGVHDSAKIGKVVKCEVCHGPGGGRDPEQHYHQRHNRTDPSEKPEDCRSDRHPGALHAVPRKAAGPAGATGADRGRGSRRNAPVHRLPQSAFTAHFRWRAYRSGASGQRRGRQEQDRSLRRLSWQGGRQRRPSRSHACRTERGLPG